MIVCPNCSHPNPDGAIQCEACYTPLPATTSCPSCGASVQSDASFCGQCGFNLRAYREATAAVAAPVAGSTTVAPDIPVPPPLVTPEPQPETFVVTSGATSGPLPPTAMVTPEAAPAPIPVPEVAPAPAPAPIPIPEAVAPAPAPIPVPEAVAPAPIPVPEAVTPAPEIAPIPVPEAVAPAPEPAPAPAPEAAPEAAPVPEPIPATSVPAEATIARTQLQQLMARLVHVQTDAQIELSPTLSVIHIGKPNDRIPPDVDVSGFPNSEIVSRVHADIRVEGDAFYIEDVGSSNGTYINNLPLLPGNRHRLRPGDRISMGKGDLVTFLFQLS
ncbi:MAG: FHA domain-containing protein [Scytonematopsis contorta HA4267-MV1]|nr:FHA domain-containing protein [Scytonematopsis contorta HA4267-MV1]